MLFQWTAGGITTLGVSRPSMPPKTPAPSPARGARAKTRPSTSDEKETSPAIPLDNCVLVLAIADLRTRLDELSATYETNAVPRHPVELLPWNRERRLTPPI